ncbi:MAG: hypothetical protein E7218_05285 [Anaerofustis stercorihominis]|nr:hypothetical protein [Anaerofustis stercorihominis]
MIIKELHLIAFGKFHNKVVKFEDGLNVIAGDNEAGKSTMHKFIEGMFFGFYKPYSKNKIYTSDYERCLPWSGNDYKGAIVYEHADRTYRIERNFLKGKEWVKLYDHNTNEDLTWSLDFDNTAKIPKANKHINITGVMFRNTASISQLGNPTGEELSREIGDLFVNATGTYSAGISLNKALDILNKNKDSLGTRKRSKSPYGKDVRELEELIIKRDEIIAESEENKQKCIRAKETQAELNILREQKDNLVSIRDNISYIKAINKYERYVAADAEAKQLKEEIDSSPVISSETEELFRQSNNNIDRAEEKIYELEERLNSEQTQYKAFRDSSDILNSTIVNYDYEEILKDEELLTKKTEQLEKHRQKQAGESANADVFKKYKSFIKTEKHFTKISLALGVLMLIASLLGVFIDTRFIYIAAALAVGTFATFIIRTNARSKRIEIEPEYERFDTLMSRTTNLMLMCELDIDSLVKKYSCNDARELLDFFINAHETRKEVERLEAEMQKSKNIVDSLKEDISAQEEIINSNLDAIMNIYKEVGCDGSDEFYNLLEKSNKRIVLETKYNSVLERIDEILLNEDVDDLTKKYETAINMNLSGEYDNEDDIANELDRINEDILNATSTSAELISEIKRSEENMESLNAICERISSLEEAIADYENELKAYDIAINEINELSKEIRSSFSEEFNSFISKTVSDITNKKYSDVVVTDELNIMVMDKEHNQLVDMSSLSGGTIDQLYFAMRFAIMDLVLSDRSIPVFLDDCFTQYDDRRLRNVLKFLYKRSVDRQVLIFTCRNQERDSLVDMGAEFNYIRM